MVRMDNRKCPGNYNSIQCYLFMRISEKRTNHREEFVAKNDRVANEERVFMANCEKCHPGGEGELGPAINPNPAPGFVKRFQMRHGLGVMPAFKKDEISKKDLRDVSKFLVDWKHYN